MAFNLLRVYRPSLVSRIDPADCEAVPGQVVAVKSVHGKEAGIASPDGTQDLGLTPIDSLHPLTPAERRAFDRKTGMTPESRAYIC